MSPLTTSLLTMAMCVLAYAVYRTKKVYRTWKDRGVKHEEPVLFLGNFLRTLTKKANHGERLKEVCDMFPAEKIVGFYEFLRPVLVVKDPECVEAVLIKDFNHFYDHGFEVDEKLNPADTNLFTMTGRRWRAYRTKLSPIFTTGKLKSMYGLMMDIGDNLMKAIDREEEMVCLELKDVLGRFAMDVIGSFAFGFDSGTLADPESKFRKMGKTVFEFNVAKFLKFMFIFNFPDLAKRLGLSFNDKRVLEYFVGIIKDAIRLRTEGKTKRKDFLDLMLQLREKGSVELTSKDPGDGYLDISDNYTTDKFEVTDDLMFGQAFVFLTAGFEATAATMNLAFYELSKNPGIQERVREEIREKVRENGSLSFDAVKDMTFLDMCLKETLRKYPPAQVLFRNCTKEYSFSNGLVVKPGEKLIIPVFSIHRNDEYYPDPDKFDPERFGPDLFQKPCTFMPFGEGPRTCIAMRFALQQMKFCIAKILMSYRIKLNAKSKNPIELSKKTFITSTKDPLYFDLEKVTS